MAKHEFVEANSGSQSNKHFRYFAKQSIPSSDCEGRAVFRLRELQAEAVSQRETPPWQGVEKAMIPSPASTIRLNTLRKDGFLPYLLPRFFREGRPESGSWL